MSKESSKDSLTKILTEELHKLQDSDWRETREHRRPRHTSSSDRHDITPYQALKESAPKRKKAVPSAALFIGIIAVLLVTILLTLWFQKPNSEVKRRPRGISSTRMGSYRKWIAVTGTRECEGVPRKIFERNGTIGDVAVASILCICVVTPHRCGLGGGFFAIYYKRANKTAYAISSRERAPNSARIGMFSERDGSVHGALAVGVFGELRGYQMILNTTGTRVDWADLFEDAIRYAADGFAVYGDLEKFIKQLYSFYESDKDIRGVLINATTGRPLDIGHRLVNKNLAYTLRNASVNGPETLSVGHFAETLALEIKEGGGIVTARDFEDFAPVIEPPLRATLSDGARLYTVPLPSGGAFLAYVAGIIDKFRDSGGRLPDDEYTWHRVVEAFKFGFGKRPSFRDPYADDITEQERQALLDAVNSLLMANVTKAVSTKIRDKPQLDSAFYGLIREQLRDHGSGQLCIISPNGDAFAMTSSINTEFGALFLSHHTGIWMNNVMNDFSTPYADNVYGLPPAYANFIAARKRPMSSLAPSIVVDAKGDVMLAITSTGSGTIGSGIAQVLARILWMGHTVKEAIDCGRLYNQLYPDEVRYESTVDNDVLDGLRRRGHKTVQFPWEGNVIAAARDARTNLLNGSYDYRNQSSGGVDGGN